MLRRIRARSPWVQGLAGLGLLVTAQLRSCPAAAWPLTELPPEETVLLRIDSGRMGILTLPGRASPETAWPVVLLLPDADGPGPRSGPYGQRLLDNGYAVLEVDFGGGGPDSPLADLPADPPLAARLGLVLAGIAAEPRLDPGRIAVLGLGEGARAALFGLGAVAAASAPEVALPHITVPGVAEPSVAVPGVALPEVGVPGVAIPGTAVRGIAGSEIAALALLYPGCDATLAEAARRVPGRPHLLLLHGDEDAANDASACAALAGAFPAQDRVRHRVLSGASYGWDAASLVRPGGGALLPHPAAGGRRVWSQPDPQTATVAADRVLGLVVTALGRW